MLTLGAFANAAAASASTAGPAPLAISATLPWRPTADPIGPVKPSPSKPYPGPAGLASPWTPLAHQPPIAPGSMELMSDGSVLVYQDNTGVWSKLRPSAGGSYVNGTWSSVATMPSGYTPLYTATAVLPSGQMIVEGGEYNGTATPVWTTQGALYSPVTNSWRSVSPPSGWSTIGDAQSVVLANGRFMLANCCTTDQALLNPANVTWTPTGTGKADINDEEGWTLLPNGKVITVDSSLAVQNGIRNSELYTPSSGSWASAGLTPDTLPDRKFELGPQVFNPGNNTMLAIGATGANDVYHYATSSWSKGPRLPPSYDNADGSATLMPGGNILLDASPTDFHAPTHFWVYNGISLVQVADPPHATAASSFETRMLVLPTGQILYDDGTVIEIYTATGTGAASLKPTISSVPTTLTHGATYTLSGTQLAGRDQGAAYGDDFQDNTNYPLVRVTNKASNAVTYTRTSNWSSVSIAAGAPSNTRFTLSSTTPKGASTVAVVANGIASSPVNVTVR